MTATATTAQAADTCGGYQILRTVGVKGDLRLYLQDDFTWCAIAYHTSAYYGTSLPTAVQIVGSNGALSPTDSGNYAYYAGPVRMSTSTAYSVYASAWVGGEHVVTGYACAC